MGSAGSLYVEIVPSFKTFSKNLADGVSGPATDAGAQAGKAISDQVVAAANRAGSDAGRGITSGVVDSARTAGSDAGRAITDGVVSQSRTAGESAGKAIADGVVTAAKTAGTQAGAAIEKTVVAAATETGAKAGEAITQGGKRSLDELSTHANRVLGEVGESLKSMAEVVGGMWVAEQVTDFFKEGSAAAQNFEAINRQTAAAIASTGGVADVSSGEIKELTESLADMSGRTDDVVQSALNILLTFPEVRNEVGDGNDIFNQTAEAATNLAARMGTDLNSAMVMVGKAVEDPVQGMTTLRRVGVMLTDQQQQQVKAFIAAGDVMSAQKIVLGELTREFAGSAAAATTPTQRMHVEWDRLQVAVSERVVPIMGVLAGIFADKVIPAVAATWDWLVRNENTIKALASVIGGAVGAWLLYRTAINVIDKVTTAWRITTEAATVAVKLLTGATEGLEAAEVASGVGLIVLAIGALVGGLIYCYTRFQWFRDGVDAVFRWLGGVGVVVWHALVVAALAVAHAAEAAGHGFMVGLRAVGDAAVWLWRTILEPAFHGIEVAAEILFLVVATVLIYPWVLAWRYVLGPIVLWLWHEVIEPAFHGIGAAAMWLWREAIQPAFHGIGWLAGWLYDHAIKPFSDGTGVALRAVADAALWLWHTIIEPVFDGIGTAASWTWEHVLKPVFDAISAGARLVGQAFEDVERGIENVWTKIRPAVAVPVNFVLDKVYNGGIRATWNWIAEHVGLSNLDLPAATLISGFATGGLVPGVDAGRDTVPALLRPEEFVLVPEAARYLGVGNLLALNQRFTSGGAAPAAPGPDGVVRASVGGWITSHILDPIGSAADAAWQGVKSIAGVAVDFVADPVGSAQKLLNAVISDVGGDATVADDIGQMALGLPKTAVHWLTDKLSSWFASIGGAAANVGAGVQRWAPLVLQALAALGQPASWLPTVLRRMNQESGGNPAAINLWDSNAKAGDPSRGLMQVIGSTFAAYRNPAWSDNIYDPLANIYAGLNYALHTYGSLSALDRPGGYDSGGLLPPGLSTVYNGTGRPEPVLTDAQWDAVMSNMSGDDGGSMEISGQLTVNGLDAHIDGRITKANQATGTRIARGVRG